MAFGSAAKLHPLPTVGVIATIATGASAGLSAADSFLWFDAGLFTPFLAAAGGVAAARYILRSEGRSRALVSIVASVVAIAALVTVAAALADGAIAEFSLISSGVALGAMALTLSAHERTTVLASTMAIGSAVFALGFAYSDIVDHASDYGAAARFAAWVFAAGHVIIALVYATAYGVALQGSGTKRIRGPVVILLVAYSTPLLISFWISAHESRGLTDRLIQVILVLVIPFLVSALHFPVIGVKWVMVATLAVSLQMTLCLLILGKRHSGDDPFATSLLYLFLAGMLATNLIKGKSPRAPKFDQIPPVTPETFKRVAFPVTAGSAGALAVGPIPDAPPGEAESIATALRVGETVVIDGDRITGLRMAASVAAGWSTGDSLVVWVSGETQDRIDTGLARGVEAVVQAGGARGPVFATVGAAMVAHRYFRAFPGPVLVIVDGWSEAAAERLSPRLWHGAASLLLVGGRWQGARVVTAPGESASAQVDVSLPDAGPLLEAAILAGSPHISRRALALLIPDSDLDRAASDLLAGGIVREALGGTHLCVAEDVAARYLAAWRKGGDLGRRVSGLLERVAHHLPEHEAPCDPRSPTLDLAEAGVELWAHGNQALSESSVESAAQAMHRVVGALIVASDRVRAYRLARDVEERVLSAPGISDPTRLQARVDVACLSPKSSCPPSLARQIETLAHDCRASLGEHSVTTAEIDLTWILSTWQDWPRSEALERVRSVATRLKEILGPEAPLALEAERYTLSIRVLTNDHIDDVDASIERARRLEVSLSRPNKDVPESYLVLILVLDSLGRHDEVAEMADRALAILIEDYGDLHPLRTQVLWLQVASLKNKDLARESLLRAIDVHPIVELTLPWTSLAFAAPMEWVGYYCTKLKRAEARALLESVGERLKQACPPGSPLHENYVKALNKLNRPVIPWLS